MEEQLLETDVVQLVQLNQIGHVMGFLQQLVSQPPMMEKLLDQKFVMMELQMMDEAVLLMDQVQCQDGHVLVTQLVLVLLSVEIT